MFLNISVISSRISQGSDVQQTTFSFPHNPGISVDINSNLMLKRGNLLSHSSEVTDLAWIIPSFIAGIIMMIVIAVACFYCLRHLEINLMSCCYKYCCVGRERRSAGETRPLIVYKLQEQTNLKGHQVRHHNTTPDTITFDPDNYASNFD